MKVRHGLRHRLMQGNMLILMVAVLVFSSAFFAYYLNTRTQSKHEQVQNLTDTASAQLENSIFMLESIALQLSTNSYVSDALAQASQMAMSDNEIDLWLLHEMDNFIWSYIVRVDVASRICVFSKEGVFIAVGSATQDTQVNEYATPAFMQRLQNEFEKGKTVQHFVYPEDVLSTREGEGYLSVIRAINSYGYVGFGASNGGYAEVQLSLRSVEKSFESLQQPGTQIALYDSQAQAFCVGESELFPQDALSNLPALAASGEIASYQNGFLQVREIPDTGLLLCVYDDATAMRTENVKMGWLLFFFDLCIIGLVAMVEVRFVNRMTAPLLSLFEQVREQGMGKENRLAVSQDADELTELHESFNQMLDALQKSSNELIGAQVSNLRAQLLALQAQIDPHFIHNTLSVIVALAQEENFEMVEEVAMRLSEIIRYSSSFDEPMCTMAQELKHLENYLELISVRYEENFSYTIAQPDEVAQNIQFRVPRFIAQPIAENALKYSLKEVDYPWNIHVEYECDQYHWRLIIVDNGLGITQSKSDEIMRKTYLAIDAGVDHLLEELKIGGLSLLNIAARLYLTYGNDMIFCICPAEEKGTKVILGGNVNAD